jgi:hypothetical protein
VTKRTWYDLLETALENGWNPLGVARPDWWMLPGEDLFGEPGELPGDGYTGEKHGLVLFEDALNLADALERAIADYEPEWTRFQEWGGVALSGVTLSIEKAIPSLGAMGCLVDFCRMGAFHIQPPILEQG